MNNFQFKSIYDNPVMLQSINTTAQMKYGARVSQFVFSLFVSLHIIMR